MGVCCCLWCALWWAVCLAVAPSSKYMVCADSSGGGMEWMKYSSGVASSSLLVVCESV